MPEDVKVLPTATIDNTLDTFMKDDPVETIKLDDEPKKSVKKEIDEEPEEEELKADETEETSEEDSDLGTGEEELIIPPRVKDITAKYPEFLKDFPFFKQMMFKDRDLTEMGISTIDDAKELVERVDNFSKYEQDLLAGKTESTLKTIKVQDPDAFGQLVDNYLPTLYEVDPQACAHVVNNIHRQNIKDMVAESQKSGNEDLKIAANILHQWVFGHSNWQEPTRFSKEIPKEKDDVNKERENFARERFENARTDLTEKFDNALKATITQNIDPKGVMPAYVKKHAISDALKNINSLIASDRSFKAVLDKKWEAARRSNYSKDSMNAIKTTLLSRAKPDLKDVIFRARKEAMDGLPARIKSSSEEKEERPSRSAASTTSGSKKGDIPAGMSTKDYFMAD
jgi:hypothetical protein